VVSSGEALPMVSRAYEAQIKKGVLG
jgi:hypothetical protein